MRNSGTGREGGEEGKGKCERRGDGKKKKKRRVRCEEGR